MFEWILGRKKPGRNLVIPAMVERGGEILRARYGTARISLFVGKDEPAAEAVLHALTEAGHTVTMPESTETAANILKTVSPDGQSTVTGAAQPQAHIICGVGDSGLYEKCAVACRGEDRFVFLYTDFASAMTLPQTGIRAADLTVADPVVLSRDRESPAYIEGLVRALRLGICLDASVFGEVYSTYVFSHLLGRCRTVLSDIETAPADARARAVLNLGEHSATAVTRLAAGEVSRGEALAVGILCECRAGVRAGICRSAFAADVDGALTYHGLPRAVCATAEEWERAFMEGHDKDEALTLTLPARAGTGKSYPLTWGAAARLTYPGQRHGE